MISGIHLATALSVMLHMEQEGNGMETKELRFALLKGCVWDASISRVNESETNVIMERAADRLSEQQQVIDELVNAMEMIAGITPCPDDLMGNVDIAHAALSRVKGHTKETE